MCDNVSDEISVYRFREKIRNNVFEKNCLTIILKNFYEVSEENRVTMFLMKIVYL